MIRIVFDSMIFRGIYEIIGFRFNRISLVSNWIFIEYFVSKLR